MTSPAPAGVNREDAFDLALEIRRFESQYIEHGRIAAVLDEIREVIRLGASSNEAICLHVSGPPGVGKSTIRTKIMQEFRATKNARSTLIDGYQVTADHIPLLQVEMPVNPSVKSLCYAILEAFGDEEPRRSTETVLTFRVSRFLYACGTSALLVDEAQRIVDKNGIVAGEHMLDWFKWIHSKHGISIIFLGLGRLRYLFDQDSQLSRRWNAELRLEEYWWKTKSGSDDIESQAMFIAILSAFKNILPIPLLVDVESDPNAFRFFYASQGLVGPLKKLFKEALRVAAKEPVRRRFIDMSVLETAFERAIRRTTAGIENPFGPNFVMQMPPRPMDDGVLLDPASVRRKVKGRFARRATAIASLTK